MARRSGFSIHSLTGAVLGGLAGYFSIEIGEMKRKRTESIAVLIATDLLKKR